jgi:hypothetical protein
MYVNTERNMTHVHSDKDKMRIFGDDTRIWPRMATDSNFGPQTRYLVWKFHRFHNFIQENASNSTNTGSFRVLSSSLTTLLFHAAERKWVWLESVHAQFSSAINSLCRWRHKLHSEHGCTNRPFSNTSEWSISWSALDRRWERRLCKGVWTAAKCIERPNGEARALQIIWSYRVIRVRFPRLHFMCRIPKISWYSCLEAD